MLMKSTNKRMFRQPKKLHVSKYASFPTTPFTSDVLHATKNKSCFHWNMWLVVKKIPATRCTPPTLIQTYQAACTYVGVYISLP